MNRSSHSVEKEELMAYLDGELTVDRAASVATHVEQCGECQAVAGDLKFVYQQMSAWQVEPSATGLDDKVMPALAAEAKQAPVIKKERTTLGILGFPLPRRWAWAAVVGAAAVVVLLIGFQSNRYLRVASLGPAPERSMNYINPRAPTVAPSEALGTTEQSSARAMNDQESELGVPSPPTVGPMIARTASLNIVAKDFDKARAALDAIVRQHRGYAASLTVTSQPGSGRELKASLRVPADQLDAVIAETKKLGIVEQESQGGEEVTQQDVDLRTRLSNARVEEQRLVELLRDRTGKVGDVLAVEREIARVRGDIETMDADLKNLEHRVQFATLDVQLDEEYKAELQATSPSTGIRLRNSLVQGYRDAVDSVLGLVMFLLSTGPTLLFWALILFWPVRFVWRRLWRRFGKPGNAVAAPAAGQTGQPL